MAYKSSSRRVSPKTTFSAAGDHTYSGLEKVAGIRAVTCSSLRDLTCPLCATTSVAVLVGKVDFSAKISGDDLCQRAPQPLVAVACSNSHVFFLLEKDMASTKLLRVMA
jgi:hypothetical protein